MPNLRMYRESFGLTRKQLAEAISGTAIKENQIYSYEREENGSEPSLEVLLALADFFEITVDELLGRTSGPSPVRTGTLRLELFVPFPPK